MRPRFSRRTPASSRACSGGIRAPCQPAGSTAVQTGADDVGAVVLLKGADTLVASPGRGVLVCDLGNPGLATAGTGDVLTGIVAAFLSKGMGAKVGAAAAAAAGGEAAGLAAETHGTAGMIASDVVEALSPTLSR